MKARTCVLTLIWLCACAAQAQELSPRAFWPAPEGTTILTTGYSFTRGDLPSGRTAPVQLENSDLHRGLVAMRHTFGLFGRTANVLLEQGYAWVDSNALLDGVPVASREYEGPGDTALSLSVNLVGAPTLTPEMFAQLRAAPRPILGVSARITAPTGRYNDERVLNTGANRWSGKLEVGYMRPLVPRWLLEFEAGVTLFGDDDDFVLGKKEQDPVYAAEFHLVHRFRPGFWASLDTTYYDGGENTIAGVGRDDDEETLKIGTSLVFPFDRRRALKIGYSRGSPLGNNNDFETVLASLQWRLR